MGMFDQLRIHLDMLPIEKEEKLLLEKSCGGEFQIKSLQRSLIVVEITTNGKLLWVAFDKKLYISADELPQDYSVKEGEEFLPLMGRFQVPLRKVT